MKSLKKIVMSITLLLSVAASHAQTKDQLKPVFDTYFLLKDALVKTDSKAAASASKDLWTTITSVKMETLKTEEHMVWMKISKDLSAEAKSISETQDIKKQRELFGPLSKNI